jgi:hypothetical protein
MFGRSKRDGDIEADQLWAGISKQVAPLYGYWVDIIYSRVPLDDPNTFIDAFGE